MRVISSPPVQQKLDALIDEAEKAGCVVQKIELSTREFDMLVAAGKLDKPSEDERRMGAAYSFMSRAGKYRGFRVTEDFSAR